MMYESDFLSGKANSWSMSLLVHICGNFPVRFPLRVQRPPAFDLRFKRLLNFAQFISFVLFLIYSQTFYDIFHKLCLIS